MHSRKKVREQFTNAMRNLDKARECGRSICPDAVSELFDKIEDMMIEGLAKRSKLNTTIEPNESEIDIGLSQGKIPAIRAYRDRTGAALRDAKNTLEDFFTTKGYAFAN
jgi:hypothetical protein